jgi:hypothetical protein
MYVAFYISCGTVRELCVLKSATHNNDSTDEQFETTSRSTSYFSSSFYSNYITNLCKSTIATRALTCAHKLQVEFIVVDLYDRLLVPGSESTLSDLLYIPGTSVPGTSIIPVYNQTILNRVKLMVLGIIELKSTRYCSIHLLSRAPLLVYICTSTCTSSTYLRIFCTLAQLNDVKVYVYKVIKTQIPSKNIILSLSRVYKIILTKVYLWLLI